MKLTVEEFLQSYGARLGLKGSGNERVISGPHVQRPGLSLAGYIEKKKDHRILLFGKMELSYLKGLDTALRYERLKGVITEDNPLVIVTRGLTPPKELTAVCVERGVALFHTERPSSLTYNDLIQVLTDAFSPTEGVHGTLVDIYGIGVMLMGDSSIGKSEAALGLIERGHRLISDDVVRLRQTYGGRLEGTGPELNRHLLELRGIGIVNVAHLYGATSVRKESFVDLVIHLEEWNEDHYYDRIGLEERFVEFLDVKVPLYVHPVKPGRDTVLLIEIATLNHRLKEMGLHSAKEFNQKLLEEIARKKGLGKHN